MNHIQRLTLGRAFIISFLFTLFASAGTAAFAKWERHTAAACNLSHYSNLDPVMQLVYDWVGQVINYSTRDAFFICDIEDSDRFSKQNITTLNVHVYDGSTTTSVSAKACVTVFNGWGGSCGSTVSTGNAFTGEATLQPPMTVWTAANFAQFGYVQVRLPPDVAPAGGDTSAFHGYYISGI